ncbi:DUF4032 domain-containing protein [Candidatus Poriferisodalis sp.]|uniref:DUF4032 domain-containing protein n=1 Tax=Candidatus Poriferisodalis sp. TaxID=3101277 RepID=UPI003B5A31EF
MPADLQIITRQGHPDFLDLPWEQPLELWSGTTDRLISVRRGLSRHVVRMVSYDGRVYALKETEQRLAEREYRVLRHLEDSRLPAVKAVGVVTGRRSRDGRDLKSMLITRFLDFALPYQHLFRTTATSLLRDRLLDAAVVLLSRLHLEGIYWGDISLANVLFRRDAGALMAYLVDAETAECRPSLSDELREHDLALGIENIAGGLYDAISEGLLEVDADPIEITDDLLDRYRWLWAELTREDDIAAHERWRIRQRIERLNAMGFDVEELSVVQSSDGSRLRIRPVVLEEGHAHLRLRRLTGLEVQENQARTLLNAVDAYGLALEREAGHVLPESVKAYRWLSERYEPVIAAIPDRYRDRLDDAQLIYEFIEHRFERSKAAGRQVENDEAMVTFVDEVLERLPRERTLIDHDGGNDPGDVLLGAPELGAPEAPTPTAGEA